RAEGARPERAQRVEGLEPARADPEARRPGAAGWNRLQLLVEAPVREIQAVDDGRQRLEADEVGILRRPALSERSESKGRWRVRGEGVAAFARPGRIRRPDGEPPPVRSDQHLEPLC